MRARASDGETALVGMVIFLGAWTMAFLALLFVYGDMRVSADVWPPDGEPRAPLVLPAVNTVVMGLSSLALWRSSQAARRGWRALALALGAIFLALQLIVWRALWQAGLRPSSGRYGSVFYTLTVVHALHVLTGLGGLALGCRTLARARNWSLFWHFVGAVWLVLFATVYLL
jgi:heme/copper-type cytochrome/quinol oxidase subunit 3